jgi:hypothetical protein
MQTVGDIVALYRQTLTENPLYKGRIAAIIDDTGLGGGVTDRLIEVKHEEKLLRLDVIPVNFGAKIEDKKAAENYANMSTYLWAELRDGLREEAISFPNNTKLVAQLSTRKYSLNSSGKIILETKEAMKKRKLPSPDIADAVSLAYYKPPVAVVAVPFVSDGLNKESQWNLR